MAALWLLRALAWQHCCSRPCWTPGDPYVAVVQSAYFARHLGGAVHVPVFPFTELEPLWCSGLK